MKKTIKISTACLISALATTATFAESDNKLPTGIQLGLGISATTGMNGFIGYANKKFDSFWWKRLGARFDFATMSPMKTAVRNALNDCHEEGYISIGQDMALKDFDLKSHHAAALLDFYPFGNTWFAGGLRLTGGYYFGKTEFSARLTGDSNLPDSEYSFELDGHHYKYTGGELNARARADWNFSGPYVGTGFDLGIYAGFKIYMDAGVVFTNKTAELNLDIDTNNLLEWNGSSWAPADLSTFDTARAKELDDAQKDLDDIKYYPIVKLGFMYRF